MSHCIKDESGDVGDGLRLKDICKYQWTENNSKIGTIFKIMSRRDLN